MQASRHLFLIRMRRLPEGQTTNRPEDAKNKLCSATSRYLSHMVRNRSTRRTSPTTSKRFKSMKPVPKNIWTQTHCVAILKSLQSLWDQGPNKFDIKMCFINIDLLSWLNILQRQISHGLKKILSVGKPVSWFLYSAPSLSNSVSSLRLIIS